MAVLTDLVPDLLAFAPAVPEVVAITAYRNAAREFATETRLWVEAYTDLTPANGVVMLTPTDSDGEVFDVVRIASGGRTFRKRPFAEVALGLQDYDYAMAGANTIRLTPVTYSQPISVACALRPVVGAASINDALVSRAHERILYGALAYVYRMPKTEWYAPDMGEYYRKLFETEMRSYAAKAADGDQVGVVRRTRYGGY